jgi:hypothetical protein
MFKRALLLWAMVVKALGRGSRDRVASDTKEVVEFKPSNQAREYHIRAAIRARDEKARDFLVPSQFGYVTLRPRINIRTRSDAIDDDMNLVDVDIHKEDTRRLLEDLAENAGQYFAFRTELFKFHARKDRNLWDLFRRPQTYADLEEENIEERFPEDRDYRALMCALNIVIRHNQWNHIIKKRVLQAIFSVPLVVGYIWWPDLITRLESIVRAPWLEQLGVAHAAREVASVTALLLVLLYMLLAGFGMAYALKYLMQAFALPNAFSCQVLARHLTRVSAKIIGLFKKLLDTDINLSQMNVAKVSKVNWPQRVTIVFKLALWEGRRIEYLEKFWQLRFERMRLFELVSDEVGNMSSRLIAVAVIATAIGTSYLIWDRLAIFHMETLALVIAVWYLGRLTRKPKYSFDMDAIRHQFSAVKYEAGQTGDTDGASEGELIDLHYYGRVGQQFGGSKATIRNSMVEGIFPAGGGGAGGQASRADEEQRKLDREELSILERLEQRMRGGE